MRSLKILSFSLILFLLLSACSGASNSSSEAGYYRQLKNAKSHLTTLRNMSNGSKISKQRFNIAVQEHLGPTQAILKQYKGTDFAVRDSYKSIFRSFESYYIANQMWKDDKGMALVNKRLAEGSNWLSKAESAIKLEQNPPKEKEKKEE